MISESEIISWTDRARVTPVHRLPVMVIERLHALACATNEQSGYDTVPVEAQLLAPLLHELLVTRLGYDVPSVESEGLLPDFERAGEVPSILKSHTSSEEPSGPSDEPPSPGPAWEQLHPAVQLVVVRAIEAKLADYQFEEARHSAEMIGMMAQMSHEMADMQKMVTATPGGEPVAGAMGAAMGGLSQSIVGGQGQTRQAIVAAFRAAIAKLVR